MSNKNILQAITISTALLLFILGSFLIITFVPKVSRFTIIQTYSLNNKLDDSKIHLLLPVNQQKQIVNEPKIYFDKDEPLEYVMDKNNELCSVNFKNDSNHLVMLPLKVEYQVTFKENIILQKKEPDYRYYLGPRLGMETNHPSLITTARQVTASEISEAEKIQAIGYFIQEYIALSQDSNKSALTTLERGMGDTRDKALLLASLSRTRGIASRLKKGIVLNLKFPGQKIVTNMKDVPIHYWSEYYDEQEGWLHAKSILRPNRWKLEPAVLDFGEYDLSSQEQTPFNFTTIEISLNWLNHATYILLLLFILITAVLLLRNCYKERQTE